jgi:hypothetical protein
MKRGIFILTLIAVALTTSCRSSFVAIERSEYERSDSAFVHYLKSEGVPYTSNNKVTILNGAHIKFDSLFKDIKEAKHHIHLEYFNFRNDSINEVLIGLLAEKVKEGVEVRALFDAFGNLSNNRPLKLSFKQMGDFIAKCRNAEERKVRFEQVKALSKVQPSPYAYVKTWFLNNYANYSEQPEFDAEGFVIVKTKAEMEAKGAAKAAAPAVEAADKPAGNAAPNHPSAEETVLRKVA